MALVVHHRSSGHDLGDGFADPALVRSGERFVVYRARETTTERQVFVKIVARHDQRWLTDALDEQAAILGALSSHPQVITLFSRTTIPDGRPALVLEHSDGTVVDLMRPAGTEPGRAATSIGIKLAGALDAVHRSGVLHCDVRPGIVLRNAFDEPVLAGFDHAVHTHPGMDSFAVVSVPTAHTAPEVLLGEPVSARTDVYGLGATLYELLAGRSAFRAYAGESPSAVAARVLDGRVRQIVAPGTPLALSDLLSWALAPRPEDRPPSAAWLAEELRRIETDEGWPRTPFVA